jgi:hypothetical protein
MSNVIDFLERLGQDAQLRHATSTEVEQALTHAQIDPALRAAVLSGDQRALEARLGAKSNVCCMVFVPKDDGDQEEGIWKAVGRTASAA